MFLRIDRLMRYWLPGLLLASVTAVASGQSSSQAVLAKYHFLHAPDGSPLPGGKLGLSIVRGYAILLATRDSLPQNVGNNLHCRSCHLDDGRRPNAMPYTGVYARFPQYRSRSDAVQLLEDRINDCFRRSMNGKPLAWDDPAMRDIIAYMAFQSIGVPVGGNVAGQGVPLSAATHGNAEEGKTVYDCECSRCHGSRGEGKSFYPPLWGARSFSIGAGMARLQTATGYIKVNMPYDKPGSLSDQDAVDVAAYMLARARPDFVGKENDWPLGDPPVDVAYATKAGRKP